LGALSALQTVLIGLAAIEVRAGRLIEARERYSELQDVTMAIGTSSNFMACSM